MTIEQIAAIRQKIDNIDEQIVDNIAKRTKLARELAQHKGPTRDLNREHGILTKVKYQASINDVDTKLIDTIFHLLFNNSIIAIKKIKNKW
ncbi:chorismate mutase [Candidatus Parcubacteria bacterium]|jgi:chorismate mutase|nr:chorismate mutase [Candidatus Parcubacteria bacterium]